MLGEKAGVGNVREIELRGNRVKALRKDDLSHTLLNRARATLTSLPSAKPRGVDN